ncbi:MAG: PmbA/TldA family metallopeptidase, partial [Bryobacteraceae bacterium]
MKETAREALDALSRRGAEYGDVRVIHSRDRGLAVKSGKVGHLSAGDSLGAGLRVLIDGCWGFAATDDLSAAGIEDAAELAVDIARAGINARKEPVALSPERAHQAEWSSPCQIDPFSISVEAQLALLMAVDEELRRHKGVTMTEAGVTMERRRQIFASTEGSWIDQTRTVTGAGFAAHSFQDNDIQKRSYPNSFGGQYQLKGWELI